MLCISCLSPYTSIAFLIEFLFRYVFFFFSYLGQTSKTSDGSSKDIVNSKSKDENSQEHDKQQTSSEDCKEGNKSAKGDKPNKDDMLHNLLGVESDMIDHIFNSKDSAASILGVGEKSNKKWIHRLIVSMIFLENIQVNFFHCESPIC